ncbi:hypothetical protein [Acrocarpospora catenulata]|uniref:hypothetical protein n=1 Tax=Acrocarpospora catenulata TaxID=2836182 RepID=UPI001BD967D2|nr:hypothetical protein [Acrocarpospora catenulata]
MKRVVAVAAVVLASAGCSAETAPRRTELRFDSAGKHLAEHWGIKFTSPSGQPRTTQHGSVTQPSGGRLSAILGGRRPGTVRTVSCQAFGATQKTAGDFLKDCAALPFPGPERRQVEAVNWTKGRRLSIGGVRYVLSATPERNLWVLRFSLPERRPLP